MCNSNCNSNSNSNRNSIMNSMNSNSDGILCTVVVVVDVAVVCIPTGMHSQL